MKIKSLSVIFITLFFLNSCSNNEYSNSKGEVFEELNIQSKVETNESETYYFDYELTSGNEDFIKISFEDLSGESSNELLIQTKSDNPLSYKHIFKKIDVVNNSWLLWVHKDQDLITITTKKPTKVSWKTSDSVGNETVGSNNLWFVTFPLTYDKEKDMSSNEEWVIKENGTFNN